MPTNITKRTRKRVKTPLPDFVRILLLDGAEAYHKAMVARKPGTGKAEAFRMLKNRARMDEAWETYGDEIRRIRKAKVFDK